MTAIIRAGVLLGIFIICFSWNSSPRASSSGVVVIVNNDPSERHHRNVDAAIEALRCYGYEEILVFGRAGTVPTLEEVCTALDTILKTGKSLEVFYLTGHGGIIINKKNPEGSPAVMLRDRPLYAERLASLLGHGPCLVYVDQCFAPAYIEILENQLKGNFLLLSDKDSLHPQTSCRGISTRFWSGVKERAEDESLLSVAESVWSQVCEHGTQVTLDERSRRRTGYAIRALRL